MIKIAHIHRDPKFLLGVHNFKSPEIDNLVLMIGKPDTIPAGIDDHVKFFSDDERSLLRIADLCASMDLVVVHCLDKNQARIILRLPDDVLVAWRFFGFELYQRWKRDYLSDRSRAFYHPETKRKPVGVMNVSRAFLGNTRAEIRNVVRYGVRRNKEFACAVERIDFFLGICDREYEELACKWGKLPQFIGLPFMFGSLTTDTPKPRNGNVFLGNSRNIWNNHLDVIDIINEANCPEDLSFVVPFSYGQDGGYAAAVKDAAKESPRKISLLEDFMPREAYFGLLGRSLAAVFNGYRQLAMGNVFYALSSGVKVYLNEKNAVYHWLRDNGMMVYSIEQLSTDLERGTLALDLDDHHVNVQQLTRLRTERSREAFIQNIKNLIRARMRLR